MATDRYTTHIECPNCANKGKVHISENDGWSFMRARDRHIDSVPDGFTVLDHGRNHGEKSKIRCDRDGWVQTD